MRVSVLLLAILATTSCAGLTPVAPAAPGPFRFSGTISRVDGGGVSPIASASLTVVDGVNKDARASSDGAGRYVFPSLDKGRFTVSISAPGYAGITPVIDLYEDVNADFALKPQ
jgi:hypothetical protein